VRFLDAVVDGRPHAFLINTEDIEEGDQLLTDYGDAFWEDFDGVMTTVGDAKSAKNEKWQMQARIQALVRENAALKAKASSCSCGD
jgi:hypothetical protein